MDTKNPISRVHPLREFLRRDLRLRRSGLRRDRFSFSALKSSGPEKKKGSSV